MMACDICGKTGVPLEQLRDQFCTKSLNDLCESCLDKVNKELWRLRGLSHQRDTMFLKAYMLGLKQKARS